VIISLIFSIGCSKKNNGLIDKVKVFESTMIKFENLLITYDDYKANLNTVFSSSYSYELLDNKVIYGYTDDNEEYQEFKVSDFEGLSMDELKLHREKIKKLNEIAGIDNSKLNITVKVSDVYKDSKFDWKYVFTRESRKSNFNEGKMITNKRYTFTSEDDERVIKSIDVFGPVLDEDDATDEELDYMKYQTAPNNEKVKYIETFNIIESD